MILHQFSLPPILAARFNNSFAEIVPASPSPFPIIHFFPLYQRLPSEILWFHLFISGSKLHA